MCVVVVVVVAVVILVNINKLLSTLWWKCLLWQLTWLLTFYSIYDLQLSKPAMALFEYSW